MNIDFSFQVFAWTASVLYAVEFVISKLISKHSIKDPWFFNFFWMLIICLFTVPVALYFGPVWPYSWTYIILAGLFDAIASIFFIFALYKLDISAFGPLFNIRTIFVVILAALFLGEHVSSAQLVLILAMVLGGILVTMDERLNWHSFFSWTGGLVLLDMLALALMAIFIKKAVSENGYWPVALWMLVVAQIFVLPTILLFKQKLKDISLRQTGFLSVLALFGFSGTLAANKGYSLNAGLSAAIISLPLSSVIAFAFSVFAPKLLEKHTVRVYIIRFIGAAIMVYAGIKLT